VTGPVVALAAGGTGGHLFPAEALSHALGPAWLARAGAGAQQDEAVEVVLLTDTRAIAYATTFPAARTHSVPAATPSGGNPLAKLRSIATLSRGVLAAVRLLRRERPSVVVGFGGYPSVPPVLAASLLRIPTVIHEQNAVAGRANRLLARRATVIATGFAEVTGFATSASTRCRHVGNPIRPAVLAAAAAAYDPPSPNGSFRLLITGGSQGARVLSTVLPEAIAALDAAHRDRLDVVHQARGEDEASVRAAYERLGIRAEVRAFFDDLPARLAAAHLVIGRAGASTVAELGVIGRPSVLVPLLGSLDQDQAANAAFLERAGAAVRIMQPDFTPDRLVAVLGELLDAPERLTAMAAAARATGLPDAPQRLAELVLETAADASARR
jgi:UDP-N-acetylglucosamine--N-acetylmuramyl-(pentapeptide) pyrophosphoryl-undecaprenol N-acetylglucosamine transferase